MTRTKYITLEIEDRHGSAYDRGRADAYYERPFDPHYFVDGTHTSPRVAVTEMTPDEILQYTVGYQEETRRTFDDSDSI